MGAGANGGDSRRLVQRALVASGISAARQASSLPFGSPCHSHLRRRLWSQCRRRARGRARTGYPGASPGGALQRSSVNGGPLRPLFPSAANSERLGRSSATGTPWGPVRCQRRDADDARVQGDSPSMHDACRTPAAAANDLDGLTWARLRTRKRFSWAPPLGNVPVTPYVARLPFRHRSGACTAGSPLIEMPRRRQDRWEPAHTGHHDVCGRELLCVTPADCAFARSRVAVTGATTMPTGLALLRAPTHPARVGPPGRRVNDPHRQQRRD